MIMITITTYYQLIEFIRANKLNVEQSKKLIEPCLNVLIILDYETTEDLIKLATDFWNKWKHTIEKPIFMDDLNLDVED